MRVKVLGCGPSGGVPGISYGWGRCNPDNPRNKRLRPSIMLESGTTRVLVDTAPDLRQQLLNAEVTSLDAVLYTHAHADHLHGIDDLRSVNRVMNRPLDCFSDTATLSMIRQRFAYAFAPLPEASAFYFKPTLIPHEVEPGKMFQINGLSVLPMAQNHGYGNTLGFLFDDRIAYSTDLVEMPEENFERLRDVDLWIIGVLTDEPAPTHLHVDKALQWVERVQPKKAVLTHLGSSLDYDELCHRLPGHVRPAYDGLELTV